MRINPQRPEVAEIAATSKASRKESTVATNRSTAATNPALASEVLSAAAQRMSEMPEVDLERVAQIRDALARGEITLDASHLANVIAAYHRA